MIFRENSLETVIAIKTVYMTSRGGGGGGGGFERRFYLDKELSENGVYIWATFV